MLFGRYLMPLRQPSCFLGEYTCTQQAFIEWDSTIHRFPPPFQNFGAKRQKQHLRWLCEPPMKIDLQEKDLTYIWLQVKALLTLLNWDVARFLLVLRDSVSKVLACWSTVTRQRDNPPLDFVLEVELYLQLRFSSLSALECPERSLSKLHHEPFNSQVQKNTLLLSLLKPRTLGIQHSILSSGIQVTVA